MATPAFQLQSVPISIVMKSPGSVFVPTNDPTGAPIDVSSGFTLAGFNCVGTSNWNPGQTPVNLAGLVTATFSTTGVTLSWPESQWVNFNSAMQTISNNYGLSLSNDGGTSKSMLAIGTLSLVNSNQLG
jgi:hypothetical protein